MDIRIFNINGGTHREYWCNAFADGLKKHNVDFTFENYRDDTECDLSVSWGMRTSCVAAQQKRGKRFLLLENGYWPTRSDWNDGKYNKDNPSEISIGYDGLNGYAKFYNKDSESDRWLRHIHIMDHWKDGGEYVLIMGQVAGDASVAGVNLNEWYMDVIEELKYYDIPIAFRAHPLGGAAGVPVVHLNGDLRANLAQARVVVTYNSNSAVEAILAGVPAITMDRGSMAWGVSGHKLVEILNPLKPNRFQWACDLAYAQWNYVEISNGDAWDHLRQGVE